MPPASPVPGCSSGEVCRDSTATRRGSRRSLTTDPSRTDTSTPDSVGCDRPRELAQGHVELLTTFRERQMSYRSEPTQDRARNLPGRVLGTARGHHLVVVIGQNGPHDAVPRAPDRTAGVVAAHLGERAGEHQAGDPGRAAFTQVV